MQIKTVIAEDHLIVLEGLVNLLKEKAPRVEVVATADDWRSCISALHGVSADVLITDLEMPGALCTDALARIKEMFPNLKIIVLTMHFENQLVRKLLEIGVQGYIVKTFGMDELTNALDTVSNGDQYIAISERNRFERIISRMASFTDKQKNVLALVTLGYQAKEISQLSGVPVSYVQTIIRDTKRKHNLKDRVHLIDFVRSKLPDTIDEWKTKLKLS